MPPNALSTLDWGRRGVATITPASKMVPFYAKTGPLFFDLVLGVNRFIVTISFMENLPARVELHLTAPLGPQRQACTSGFKDFPHFLPCGHFGGLLWAAWPLRGCGLGWVPPFANPSLLVSSPGHKVVLGMPQCPQMHPRRPQGYESVGSLRNR